MPGRFQAGLIKNERPPVAANVSLGSLITIRHHSTYGFLHSHDFFYESGSRQQQVTIYGYRDLNNVWMVDGLDQPKEGEPQPFEIAPSSVESGAFVRLKHMNTNRYLHTHGHKAPVSENDWQTEVSAYGADGYPGDLNDLWRLELVPQLSEQVESWQALATVFRLQHVVSGCYLFSHPTKLPKWGFEQNEVTCAQTGILENSLWYVETNYHPMFDSRDPKDYIEYTRMSMAEKYVAYVDSMLKVARQFSDKIDGSNFWKVDAWQLPFLVTGMSYFRHHHRQVYLFGNIITWWCSIGCIVAYLLFKISVLIVVQRGHRSAIEKINGLVELDHIVGRFIAGWLALYIPLWSKQHEMTDYLPALYFSILVFVAIWDFRLKRWRPSSQYVITAGVMLIVVYFFYVMSPLAYGAKWLKHDCESWQMRGTWKFYCNYQLETPEEYKAYDKNNVGTTYFYVKPPKEEPPEDSATPFEGYLEPEYSNNAIWKEFEAMEYTPSHSILDLHDPTVQRILLGELDKRNMTVEDYALKRALSEAKELEQEVKHQVNEEIESRIAVQWARITDPPKFNPNEQTTTAGSSIESAIPVDGDPEESVD
ncbi:hypothetical protein TRVA0_012S02014 [Trichomonascus vanleenenianus]|uniref:uncharacterized protein n=1 Tax=Trichomonascus vanleenenianus TaxID=2268995 RepID=UPI003ECA502B